MKIESLPISAIKPYERNAKEHPKKQIKQIAASIEEFGFNQPVVINAENVIIVGHGRYLAAQLLGKTEVPCLRVALPEEKAKAYRLADNKLNESPWEMDLVIAELKELSLQLVDLTGFDSNLVLETHEDKNDVTVPETPTAKHGDVYELGVHRLMCGDSTNPEDYRKLLGDERPRLIFTDPPYSIDYQSEAKAFQSDLHMGYEGKILNDNKSAEDASRFYRESLKNLYEFSAEDASIFWWFAARWFDINVKAFAQTGWHYSQTAVWLKNALVYSPGQLFHRIYEPCLVGWKEGHDHFQSMTFSNITELWTLDKKNFADYLDMWYQKRDPTSKYLHPTQKPIQLAERALKRCSEKGDLVLDAFGGSGSTLIACEQLHRKCRMMELDPKYVDTIIRRWEQFTGGRAKKV
jgi:DNA modification methylase